MHLVTNNTTCKGFIKKLRTVGCVDICVQVKRCVVVLCTCELQSRQSGDYLCEVSTLCNYDRRDGDLFV